MYFGSLQIKEQQSYGLSKFEVEKKICRSARFKPASPVPGCSAEFFLSPTLQARSSAALWPTEIHSTSLERSKPSLLTQYMFKSVAALLRYFISIQSELILIVFINPIHGDVWNYVSWRGWVNLSHINSQGSFSAPESPKSQKSCFHISLDHFQLIWAFLGIFFPQITKKCENWKSYQNIAKKWVKFQNFAIFDLYQHIINQRKAFFM